jgi:TolB-like protein
MVSNVDYPVWSGRDLIGFGTLRPELDSETLRFKVAVTADPEGAEVYVNDILAGSSPIEFELTGGKHRILVRAEGFEDAVYFVRLEGDAEIEAALEPAADEEPVSIREQYGTLVAPFVSVGDTNDQLARLFADTLLLTLEEDDRLDVVPSTVPWERRDALIHPNFLTLEESGADLVVSGLFYDDDDGLTIQANLYDVQAETIRAAVTWQGIAGLDIFDAMDEIALEFAAEVDRVLPEAGRTLVTRTETVYEGADRGESLLSRKKIINRRWSDYPNVLTVQSGFGGFFESYELEDGGFFNDAGKFDGPYLPLLLKWDRTLNSRFAVGGGINITTGMYRPENDSDATEWLLMGGLHAGPRAVFQSLRSDIIMSIDMEVQYSPEVDYTWDDGGTRSDSVGPFVYIVTPVRIGFRYYFSERIDKMPVFINGGLSITPFGYRFDLAGRGDEGFVDNIFAFELGAGVRL